MTDSSVPITPENRAPAPSAPATRDLNDRLLVDLIDAVKGILRKEQSDRLRDIYLIGDIEKDTARACIERLRELANENGRPISVYINSAGGNVTDGLAIHDAMPCTMIVTSMPRLITWRMASWMASPSVTLPPALLM